MRHAKCKNGVFVATTHQNFIKYTDDKGVEWQIEKCPDGFYAFYKKVGKKFKLMGRQKESRDQIARQHQKMMDSIARGENGLDN